MTYGAAQEKAFVLTSKTAEQSIKQMLAVYDTARSDIIGEIEKLYAKYLATTDPADYYNILIQYNRLTSLLDRVEALYKPAAQASKKFIPNLSAAAMTETYYRKRFLLEWVSPPNIALKFEYLDPRLVDLAVTGTAESWKAISDQLKERYPNVADFRPNYGELQAVIYNNNLKSLTAVQDAITQGFLQGLSLPALSKNIAAVMDNAGYMADRIARTEYTRTANAGALAQSIDAQNAGVKLEIQWMATLDKRTRQAHARLDGKRIDPSDPESFFWIGDDYAKHPGDFRKVGNNVNCRCTTIEIVNGEGPALRRGRNPVTGKNEVFMFKDFDTWAEEKGLYYNDAGALVKE